MQAKTITKKSLKILLMVVFYLCCFVMSAMAGTLYIDINNDTGIEDGTIDNPFNTIQEGIDAAALGDTVKVRPGLYIGSIGISGKNIALLGDSPATTTIQGTGASVITIKGVFSTGFTLVEIANFTIAGGTSQGIYLSSNTSRSFIHNNIIAGNANGVYCYDDDKATISNNVIINNTGSGITGHGGTGGNSRNPVLTIKNNIFTGNNRGIYKKSDSFTHSSYTVIYNNAWGNITSNTNVTGLNNISLDPLFLNPGAGNYHLSSNSPSIDAGQPIAADNDPDGTRNNQGAFGGSGAASYWPYPAGGPVVTDLSVTPSSVPAGGTISIHATGKIR